MALGSKRIVVGVLLVGFSAVAMVGFVWKMSSDAEEYRARQLRNREAGRQCGARRGLQPCLREGAEQLLRCDPAGDRQEHCMRRAFSFVRSAMATSKDRRALCERLVSAAESQVQSKEDLQRQRELEVEPLCDGLSAFPGWRLKPAPCARFAQAVLGACRSESQRETMAVLSQDTPPRFITIVSEPCCGLELGSALGFHEDQGRCRSAKLTQQSYVYLREHLSAWQALLHDHGASVYARMVAATVLLEHDLPQDGALGYLRIQALSDNRRHQASAVDLLSQLSDPRVIPEVLRIFAAVAVAPPSVRTGDDDDPVEKSSLSDPKCRPDPHFPDGDRGDGANDPREQVCGWLGRVQPSSQELFVAHDACQKLGFAPR